METLCPTGASWVQFGQDGMEPLREEKGRILNKIGSPTVPADVLGWIQADEMIKPMSNEILVHELDPLREV